MAIWQYTLLILPKLNVENAYSAFINQPETQYRKSISYFWDDVTIDLEKLKAGISKIIAKADYNFSGSLYFKDFNNTVANDCSIYFKENKITSFDVRIDLRSENMKITLQKLAIFCIENQLVLMNLRYEIIKPEIDPLIEDIKTSDSFKFLTNPIKYLDSL